MATKPIEVQTVPKNVAVVEKPQDPFERGSITHIPEFSAPHSTLLGEINVIVPKTDNNAILFSSDPKSQTISSELIDSTVKMTRTGVVTRATRTSNNGSDFDDNEHTDPDSND